MVLCGIRIGVFRLAVSGHASHARCEDGGHYVVVTLAGVDVVQPEDVMHHTEACLAEVVKAALGIDIPLPMPRISYADAMATYGKDAPDMRFEMTIKKVSDLMAKTDFKIFTGAIETTASTSYGMCAIDGLSRSKREAVIAASPPRLWPMNTTSLLSRLLQPQ